MTIPFAELRKKWKMDPDFRKEYEALKPEFKLARDLIEARAKAGLSQSDVAERMGTSQPAVARLESGHKPSLKTLERYAEGCRHEGRDTPRRWLTSECRGRESIASRLSDSRLVHALVGQPILTCFACTS